MISQECRRESNEQVNKSLRYVQIKNILQNKEMTAKEIAVEMFKKGYTDSDDRNYAAPRLTELKEMRLAIVIDKKYCEYSKRKVSVYKLVENVEKWEQIRLEAWK